MKKRILVTGGAGFIELAGSKSKIIFELLPQKGLKQAISYLKRVI